MKLEFVNEFEIGRATSLQLTSLLKKCFPDVEYEERDYFKQLPQYRILAKEDGQIIGQLGIDFRAMNLNGVAVRVFGVVDLCVHPEYQRKGIGKRLMEEFDSIAKRHPDKIDFLFLVTDAPKFYEDLGFKISNLTATWLKIDQHTNLGVAHEEVKDAFFLTKRVSKRQWKDGNLDFLGYMY